MDLLAVCKGDAGPADDCPLPTSQLRENFTFLPVNLGNNIKFNKSVISRSPSLVPYLE